MKLRHAMAMYMMPLLMLNAPTAVAQSYEPVWLNDLSIQLLIQNGCEVAYFVSAKEVEDSAGTAFQARAQCTDGRTFDAIRREGEWGFAVEQCGAVAC